MLASLTSTCRDGANRRMHEELWKILDAYEGQRGSDPR
jgi:hypothetical protein